MWLSVNWDSWHLLWCFMTLCQGSRFTAGNIDNNNKTGLHFKVSTLKHWTGDSDMPSSEKVKFGMAHCENQETVILIFLKNVIKRFKVIPHKNSTKITVPFVWLSGQERLFTTKLWVETELSDECLQCFLIVFWCLIFYSNTSTEG